MCKTKAIVVDLDGTQADCEHRRKLKEGTDKIDFGHFLDPVNVAKDPLNVWCKELVVAMFKQGYNIIYVSGREDSLELVTREWLKKHGLPYYDLYMRKSGDYRKDTEIKIEIYNEHIKDRCEVLFVIDDRKQVVDMWREMGMVVLQCAEGNF